MINWKVILWTCISLAVIMGAIGVEIAPKTVVGIPRFAVQQIVE